MTQIKSHTSDRVLTFGKYKGCKVKDVIRDNPSYITWLQRNCNFQVTQDEIEYWHKCTRQEVEREYKGWENTYWVENMAWDC